MPSPLYLHDQPYKMLPPEVKSARNASSQPMISTANHVTVVWTRAMDEMCVRDCNEISLFFIFLFRKDFYVTYVLM